MFLSSFLVELSFVDVFVQTFVKISSNSWGKCSPRSRRSSRRRTDERMANVLVQTVSKPQKKNEMVIQGKKKKKKKGKKSEELRGEEKRGEEGRGEERNRNKSFTGP